MTHSRHALVAISGDTVFWIICKLVKLIFFADFDTFGSLVDGSRDLINLMQIDIQENCKIIKFICLAKYQLLGTY